VRHHRRPVSVVVVSVILAAALGGAPVRAASGVTVRSSSVLPQQPPIGGVVRLSLNLVNDSASAWGPHDTVRIRWLRSGQTALEATQPLGQSVPPGGEATLAMVTLAPSAVGDFTLAVTLNTHGTQVALGDPVPFHLSGFLFSGRGNGHGLGMSQWGARGRGQAGQDYRSILQAYYHGVSIDVRDTSRMVRVGLTHYAINLARSWPRLYGPFQEIAGPATVDGTPLSVEPGGFLVFGSNPAGRATVLVQRPDGSRSLPMVITRPLTVRAGGPAGLRTNLLESLDSDFRRGSEERLYGGTLTIIPKTGASVVLVNTLPLEDYLKDVVPAEMPFSWGAEALKAQAIAARTYALRKILLAGPGDFDLEGTTYDQAYGGLGEERAASSEAVDATRGQVLTSGGHLIDALYMASGGGHTENSEYGFIRWKNGLVPAAVFSYLRGIPDPLDRAPAWQVGPFTPAAAAQIMRDDGEDLGDTIVGMDVLQKGPSGRILGVRVRGSSGSFELSGPGLRALFGLPDTLVIIVGGA
jgi:SpoIID/LytB domain protein